MGNESALKLDLSYFYTVKVHGLLCLELKNFIDRILLIFPAVESARPRCSIGLKSLCSLVFAMEKAKLLIQHCSECSKLYLAFTADRILWRCENIRNALGLCLGQIQNMVPTLLAAKISGIIEDLRGAKFQLESSEVEAGKVIKALLKKDIPASDSANDEELDALQFAAVLLKITSPLAVVREKRSIKKLHDKISENNRKKKILEYLLYLVRKYATQIGQLKAEDHLPHQHEIQTDNSAPLPETPLEFKCPISTRIMFDPVIIASGKTYERVWIEKWFCEGNVTCPVTNDRLENLCLTPNISMKGLISKWSLDHGIIVSEPSVQPVSVQKFSSFKSIASIGSSLNDLRLQVSNVSLQSLDTNLDSDSCSEKNSVGSSVGSLQKNVVGRISLSKLDSLPWESQRKAMQDIKEQLNKNENPCDLVLDNNFMKPLIKFLMNSHALGDVNCLNDSADVLFSFLSTSRIEMPPFDEEAIYTLTSFLDSEITGKALAIMEILSCQPNYKSGIVASGILPSILKVLHAHTHVFYEQAMKILFNLSCNNDIAYHILYLGYIPKLVPFLSNQSLAGYCLGIINKICDTEEGKRAIAETNSCIASIATLVETGTDQQQETALQVLLSLAYNEQSLHVIIQETGIQSLCSIKDNGNPRKKIIATELLQILGHETETAHVFSRCSNSTLSAGLSTDSSNCTGSAQIQPKKKKLDARGFEYLGRKISRFFLHKH